MKQSTISIRVIEPREGFYLTKKNRKENEEIVLSDKVILSALDSIDNWEEIPIEEGDRIKQEEYERLIEERNEED